MSDPHLLPLERRWSDEDVDQLKALWIEGLSCSQIGRAIHRSRNSVIGKVHRMGLAGRPAVPARGPKPRIQTRDDTAVRTSQRRRQSDLKRWADARAEGVQAPLALPDGSPVTLETLGRNMCKWPFGDPADLSFRFCGHALDPGAPEMGLLPSKRYCAAHRQIGRDRSKDGASG